MRCLGDPDLATMLWAADSFLTLLHKSGHFLTPEEQEHRVVVGELFLKVYTKLAAKAVAGKKTLAHKAEVSHVMALGVPGTP